MARERDRRLPFRSWQPPGAADSLAWFDSPIADILFLGVVRFLGIYEGIIIRRLSWLCLASIAAATLVRAPLLQADEPATASAEVEERATRRGRGV